MPNIKLADCRLICANVVESIARGLSAAGFPVTTTIGSRTFDIAPRDSSNALEAVDLALYRAKAQGRNRAVSL
jgi:GGDEF domain-containing protein